MRFLCKIWSYTRTSKPFHYRLNETDKPSLFDLVFLSEFESFHLKMVDDLKRTVMDDG